MHAPSKHEPLNQCWSSVGPPSTTSAQHWTNIGSMYRVCWVWIQISLCPWCWRACVPVVLAHLLVWKIVIWCVCAAGCRECGGEIQRARPALWADQIRSIAGPMPDQRPWLWPIINLPLLVLSWQMCSIMTVLSEVSWDLNGYSDFHKMYAIEWLTWHCEDWNNI